MIRPTRGRILVRVNARTEDIHNPHQLILVDKKKHFEGSRKGVIEAVGRAVYAVKVGEVVVFRGDAGFTLDYDPEEKQLDELRYRWLRESDCLAVEDPEPEGSPLEVPA